MIDLREQFEEWTGYSNRDDDKYKREYIKWLEWEIEKIYNKLIDITEKIKNPQKDK